MAHPRSDLVAAGSISAACSASAAGPRASVHPSTSTSGMSSRTEDDVKASSASSTRSRGIRTLLDAIPAPRRKLHHRRPRDAGQDAELERRCVKRVSPTRHQTFVTVPSRTIPSVSTKSASSAPRRRASASAAMLTA